MILFSEILKESQLSLEQRQLFILSSRVQRLIALARRKTKWDIEVVPLNKGYVITRNQGSTYLSKLLMFEGDVLRNLQSLIEHGLGDQSQETAVKLLQPQKSMISGQPE